MADRYPGYDVLAKRNTPSWNEQTRRVIDARLAIKDEPQFLTPDEFATLRAIAARITPQPAGRPEIPVAGLVDAKLQRNQQDGYRGEGMPGERDAWRRGLAAIDAEAQAAHGKRFGDLAAEDQDALLRRVEAGDAHLGAWAGMPPQTFFKQRLLTDVVHAYWSHPTAWSEIGWGGPASPRGYVRMGYDERDPWEAVTAGSEKSTVTVRENRRVG